jgi:predicted lipoprotein with Yx(FWY)xxD motif
VSSQNRILKRLAAPGALAVAALVLAACGGGDDGGPTPAADPNSTVTAADVDGRTVLVNADGDALYTSDEEQAAGDILCVSEGCLSFWEPLTIGSGMPTGDVTGELGVVARPDGTDQVTLDGDPLYMFAEDSPGQITGDGLSDTFDGQTLTWRVVESDTGGTDTGGADTGGTDGGADSGGTDGGFDY